MIFIVIFKVERNSLPCARAWIEAAAGKGQLLVKRTLLLLVMVVVISMVIMTEVPAAGAARAP